MIHTGQLPADLGISIGRVVKGFLASAVIGIILGSAMGMSQTVNALFHPFITTIRQIPMIAWIPLIILWAGIGEGSKVIIIVIAAVFPILVNTMSGITGTPQGFAEVAKLYKLGNGRHLPRYFTTCPATDVGRIKTGTWGFLDGGSGIGADCGDIWYWISNE